MFNIFHCKKVLSWFCFKTIILKCPFQNSDIDSWTKSFWPRSKQWGVVWTGVIFGFRWENLVKWLSFCSFFLIFMVSTSVWVIACKFILDNLLSLNLTIWNLMAGKEQKQKTLIKKSCLKRKMKLREWLNKFEINVCLAAWTFQIRFCGQLWLLWKFSSLYIIYITLKLSLSLVILFNLISFRILHVMYLWYTCLFFLKC